MVIGEGVLNGWFCLSERDRNFKVLMRRGRDGWPRKCEKSVEISEDGVQFVAIYPADCKVMSTMK